MELRTLKTFVRIAEILNFSRTAEELGYSQSAVTMQIKQLEQELQTQLFERLGKQVTLTQAGERLLPWAVELLDSAQQAVQAVRDDGTITGRLRVGTCESYIISRLPPVIEAFTARCPQVELQLCTASVEDMFQRLRQNDVDLLYFLDRKQYFPDWVKPLERPEHIYFVTSAASPLATEQKIPVERLLREPLYLTERGVSYRYAIEQALAEQGFALHPVLEVGNTDVILRFLRAGRGVSFLPEYVIREDVAQGRLAILNTQCPEIIQWSQLAYLRRKCITPQMRCFLELMNVEVSSC